MPKRFIIQHAYVGVGDELPFSPYAQVPLHVESEVGETALHIWWVEAQEAESA